jgi:hypothetical protein
MTNKPPKKITITPDGIKITQEEMVGSNISCSDDFSKSNRKHLKGTL